MVGVSPASSEHTHTPSGHTHPFKICPLSLDIPDPPASDMVVITGDLFKFVHLMTYPQVVLISSGDHPSGRHTSYRNAFL